MQPIWYDNDAVEAAIDTATRERKPLLVDFWDPTCYGCAKLFATTYADARVQRLLATSYVCVKYDTSRPNAWFKRLNGAYAHHWHPNIVVMDHRLTEARRFIGYLPPTEFIAEIEVGRALVALYHRRPHEALEILRPVCDGDTSAAPEALYWGGVAARRAGGDLATLGAWWARIGDRYPQSTWALRADCLDVRIPEDGFDPSDANSVELSVSAVPGGG